MKKKRTNLTTFRLAEELINELRDEAVSSQVSLNTLVNQVLSRYVNWERHSDKFGLIQLPRPVVREMFYDYDNQRIHDIACNSSSEAVKELVLLKEGSFTIDSFVSMFNEWLRASGIIYRYKKTARGHQYVIQHNLNKPFSVYLSSLVMSILDDLQNCKEEVVIRQDSLSITITVLS